jgi:hypothetical protein
MNAANQPSNGSKVGLIARGGLPRESDVAWLRTLVGTRNLIFLGDLDPPDLLVFAWLRACRISHFGVNDAYLAQLRAVIPDSFTIQLSPTETAAMPLVGTALPDMQQLLGSKSTQTLNSGRKIEIEAVVSSLGGFARLLDPL